MRLGVMFDRDLPPEQLLDFARSLDGRVDDLWVVEDLGWTGGLTSAAAVLASTEHLRVGLGIAPAPLRNPALLAMEIGNLGRMFPGRFIGGIGHGVQDWMRQVGVAAPSPMALLEETITSVRALLRGETVTLQGKAVHLDGVKLVHPPEIPPAVVAGVKGPKGLALSGRVADGTIVPEGFGPESIESTLKQIAPAGDHELICFTNLYIGDDAETATAETRAGVAEFLQIDPTRVVMAAGTAEEAAAVVQELWAAGAQTVAVRPMGDQPLVHVERLLSILDGVKIK